MSAWHEKVKSRRFLSECNRLEINPMRNLFMGAKNINLSFTEM